MKKQSSAFILRVFSLALIFTAAFLLVFGALIFARKTAGRVYAAPIPPPEGYPKLSLSTKTVQPALAHTGGATLNYKIEVLNTGATAAAGVSAIAVGLGFDAAHPAISPATSIEAATACRSKAFARTDVRNCTVRGPGQALL